ncbi:MAG: hypothetical protein U0931_31260 [Vulcanimicrobiota bacterium]
MILPYHLVICINHWFHGLELEPQVLSGAWDELAQWGRWLEAESGFWVVEEEQTELLSIESGLAELSRALEQQQWRATFELACRLEGLMGSVNQRRARAPYSPVPAVHHCILAGGAVIIGQGSWNCLEPRWRRMETFLDNLESAHAAELESLPEEVRAAVWVGFEQAQAAVDAGRQARDAEALRAALKMLKEAGELLAFLPGRQQELADQLERQATLKIPIVGGRLESDLHSPPEEWPARAQLRAQVTLPVLERLVHEEGRGVLLPPGQEGAWDAIDLALARLRKFYETRPGAEGLLELLQDASKAFEHLEQVRIRPEALSSSLATSCVELCRSVLRGEMPDPAVEDLCQQLASLPAWAEVAQAFRDYLASGEAEALQRAAWAAPAAAEGLAGGGSGLSLVVE